MPYDHKPTETIYTSLQAAFDHLNNALFDGRLEQTVIVLEKKANSYGFFHAEQFRTRGEEQDDIRSTIALNPAKFAGRTDKEILSTLAHEMVHLRQFIEGENPPKGRSHNKEWADMMEEIDLQPTSDGTPNGKRTGAKMTHMIVPGGCFDKAADALLSSGWRLTWESYELPKGEAKPKDASKTKHTCGCKQNLWAKLGIKAVCGLCGSEFLPAGGDL